MRGADGAALPLPLPGIDAFDLPRGGEFGVRGGTRPCVFALAGETAASGGRTDPSEDDATAGAAAAEAVWCGVMGAAGEARRGATNALFGDGAGEDAGAAA